MNVKRVLLVVALMASMAVFTVSVVAGQVVPTSPVLTGLAPDGTPVIAEFGTASHPSLVTIRSAKTSMTSGDEEGRGAIRLQDEVFQPKRCMEIGFYEFGAYIGAGGCGHNEGPNTRIEAFTNFGFSVRPKNDNWRSTPVYIEARNNRDNGGIRLAHDSDGGGVLALTGPDVGIKIQTLQGTAIDIAPDRSVAFTGLVLLAVSTVVLGPDDTSVLVSANVVVIDCDDVGNDITTLTGASDGALVSLAFVDGDCTLVDGALLLALDFVSQAGATLQLVKAQGTWMEIARSAN